ncbi:rhomboid family intramembrane serine protease [Pedosphaera parvula]|nr:rhomboid family intramembrane serine protease [Pedosphaera parvula]
MIGNLEGEARARTFGDYLYALGIDNQVEVEKDDSWAVWIHNEEHLDKAKSLLVQYMQNPEEPRFRATAAAAEDRREQKRKEQIAYEKRLKERRHLFRPLTTYGFGPLTFILICASVVVFIFSKGGDNKQAIMDLFITRFEIVGGYIHWQAGLPEIRHGEVWRLITPMLIHFGFLHIFFNMLWLRDLGSMIEGRQSSLTLAILIVVFAAGSNLGQYLASSPDFGGMSGVVYGLMGYIWIRGKRDPGSGLYLHNSTVVMMIIWFFLCLSGMIGNIANTAHAVGLIMGISWGYLSSLRHR